MLSTVPTILCWPPFFCASHPIRILSASPEQLADSGRAGCERLEREQRTISGDLQLKSCGSFDKPALTSWSIGSFAAGAYPLTCCFFVLLLLPIFLRDYRFFCISRSNGISVKAKSGRANGNTLSFRSLVRFYRYNECLPRWFGCLAGWVTGSCFRNHNSWDAVTELSRTEVLRKSLLILERALDEQMSTGRPPRKRWDYNAYLSPRLRLLPLL